MDIVRNAIAYTIGAAVIQSIVSVVWKSSQNATAGDFNCADRVSWFVGISRVYIRLETTPLLSGERDWQAAVLRVVPVREECHAATRM